MSDVIVTKTPHQWTPPWTGYDVGDDCKLCGVNSYAAYGTEYCEDYLAEKQKRLEQSEHRHIPTESAWNYARTVLTQEQWLLMELDKYPHSRPYRVKDVINV